MVREHSSIAGTKSDAFLTERFDKPYRVAVSFCEIAQETVARNEVFKLQEAATHREHSCHDYRHGLLEVYM